jgi:hypothetical protein
MQKLNLNNAPDEIKQSLKETADYHYHTPTSLVFKVDTPDTSPLSALFADAGFEVGSLVEVEGWE